MMRNVKYSFTNYGFIQIYTGNGKGKTTAALGLALRARGAGLKVAIVYFDKGGTHYSERKLFKKLGIDYFVSGCDRIDPKTGRFRFGVTPADIREARAGLKAAKKFLISKKYDLVILDEINSTVDLKMLTAAEVLKVISRHFPIRRKAGGMPRRRSGQNPDKAELVLTGRNAPKEFLDIANLVTEMKLVKHYFYRGTRAREGIDF